ncbi:MAG: glutamate 5-kinase, partial [Nitrospinaceae bacterium]|nr:glutamate 5-kinase [Nitrospinaceae bacterium]
MRKAAQQRRKDSSLKSRRIVVKVGSSVLTSPEESGVNRRVLGRIVSQVTALSSSRRE